MTSIQNVIRDSLLIVFLQCAIEVLKYLDYNVARKYLTEETHNSRLT
jgi:hypothetical protein